MWLVLASASIVSPAWARPPWEHGDLRVSEDQRYLIHRDGTPFFWMGDTAWMMLSRASDEEAEAYFANRAALKFNVTLQVALGEISKEWNFANRNGDRPFLDGDVRRPNEPFWKFVDRVFEKAADREMYVGLLPTWGNWVVNDPQINTGNARDYGRFLGRRYGQRPNLIWILGGDRPPVDKDGTDYRPVWRELARGIRETAGDRHLMTYHRKYSWQLEDEPWYQIYMTGPCSGCRANPTIVNEVTADWNRRPRPIVDGEPAYEDHPVNWDPKNGWFEPFDVRLSAYWSLFSGAVGHNYGHHSLWMWYWPPANPKYGHALVTAEEALQREGARQMQHVRSLMESRPILRRVADQSLVVDNWPLASSHAESVKGERHVRATRGDGYAMLYVPHGDTVRVKLGHQNLGDRVRAWWFDPRTGESRASGEFDNRGERSFDPPGDPARGNDWILVLDDLARAFAAPGIRRERSP